MVKLAAVVQDSRCTEIDGYDCDHALSQVYVLQSMLLVSKWWSFNDDDGTKASFTICSGVMGTRLNGSTR